jgi:hypothetical protein
MGKQAMPVRKRTRAATSAVLQVGDGRGFVVRNRDIFHGDERLVITAAHCLTVPFGYLKSGKEPQPPCLPIAAAASFTEERTYKNLLGPLWR